MGLTKLQHLLQSKDLFTDPDGACKGGIPEIIGWF